MRTIRKVVKTFKTRDGRVFDKKRAAVAHEKQMDVDEGRESRATQIYRTPSGKWSIPCQNCGKRHTQRFSDDYVWCRACQLECEEGGHTPDDDDSTSCFTCSATIRG